MTTVVVLGGAGGIGSVAVRALTTAKVFDDIVVADARLEAAAAVVASIGDPRLRTRAFDATDVRSLRVAIDRADVVLNCVGPFYRFGPPILQAAIEAGTHYVDVCDDLAPTRVMLAMDEQARARGVKALLGMGNSPGLANVFVRLCADTLLDAVDQVDIMHIHGGEPTEGPAVVKHRILAMTDPVPLFVDGRFIQVQQLGRDGEQQTIDTDFHRVGTYPVYPYPHPETITLPMHIPGLRGATNRGVIFPLSYFKLTQDMVRVGLTATEPLDVGGQEVVPLDVAVAHILSQRPRLLAEAGVTGPAGCLKVVVNGSRHGEPRTLIFQLSSTTVGAGEGTGIPAAAGAVLMARGGVKQAGVLPPEAAVAPLELLMEAFRMVKAMGKGGEDSIRIQQVDGAGRVTDVPLPF